MKLLQKNLHMKNKLIDMGYASFKSIRGTNIYRVHQAQKQTNICLLPKSPTSIPTLIKPIVNFDFGSNKTKSLTKTIKLSQIHNVLIALVRLTPTQLSYFTSFYKFCVPHNMTLNT